MWYVLWGVVRGEWGEKVRSVDGGEKINKGEAEGLPPSALTVWYCFPQWASAANVR